MLRFLSHQPVDVPRLAVPKSGGKEEPELTVACTCSVMLVREEFANLSWCVLDWFAQVGPNMSQLLTYVWCEILRQPRNMQNESMRHKITRNQDPSVE